MFNPFDHPIMLAEPKWLTSSSSWQVHIPYAMFLVSLHRPHVIVELSALEGDSYFAFCQAVKALSLATTSYAVVTEIAEHDTDALAEVAAYNDQHYSGFS